MARKRNSRIYRHTFKGRQIVIYSNFPNLERVQVAALKLLFQANALSDQPTPAELNNLAIAFEAARRTTRQLAEVLERSIREQQTR